MDRGRITRSTVLQDDKTMGTVLMGTAESGDARVNFKIPYSWETLDCEWFKKELKEVLARDLGVAPSRMDIDERELLYKMQRYSEWANRRSSI
jgi:hypothetical protein